MLNCQELKDQFQNIPPLYLGFGLAFAKKDFEESRKLQTQLQEAIEGLGKLIFTTEAVKKQLMAMLLEGNFRKTTQEAEEYIEKFFVIDKKQGKIIGKGTFNYASCPFTSLPDNLSISENLYLSGSQIKSLPENLSVGEHLMLRDVHVTSLPDSLYVERSLYINENLKADLL